jgi:MFS family permease
MYLTSAVAGAFSGLLAAGIAEMHGIGGYEGWRWIFILEGLATVVLGMATWFWLADSPALSKWLTDEEKRYLEVQHFIKDGGLFSTRQHKSDCLALCQHCSGLRYVNGHLFSSFSLSLYLFLDHVLI